MKTESAVASGVGPSVNLACVAGMVARGVEYLWPGYLPLGKIVTLDGAAGLGKSTLLLDLAARVSGGREGLMPDGSRGVQGAVVYLSAEDADEDTNKPRLLAAGAREDRVHCLRSVTDEGGEREITLPGDLELLERCLRDLDARLLIVDPLTAFLSGRIDGGRDPVVRRLKRLAERTRCTVLCLRHLVRGRGIDPLYRGGLGILGAARAGLLVAQDPEDAQARLLAPRKANLSALAPTLRFRLVGHPSHAAAMVQWEGTSTLSAAELILQRPDVARREAEEENRGKLAQAEELLRQTLKLGPRSIKELNADARRLGVSGRTLRRAARNLGLILTYEDWLCGREHSWRLPGTGVGQPATWPPGFHA